MTSSALPGGPGFSLTSDELGARTLAELAASAEDLGYRYLFNAESVELEAIATAAAAVMATSTSIIGTGIVNVYSRTPFTLAMAAATLADLSGGRFVLGMGASSAALVEGAHALAFERPLSRTARTVDTVRALLRGESVSGARLLRPPERVPPIALAAVGPRMLRLAGQVADAVLLALQTPASVADARSAIGPGPTLMARILVAQPGDDPQALAHARRLLASYLSVPAYAARLRESGHDAAVERVAAAVRAGGRGAGADAVSDDLLADLVVVGSPAQQEQRLAEYRHAGTEISLLAFVTADSATASRESREAALREGLGRFRPH